jgi:hypothetical protein
MRRTMTFKFIPICCFLSLKFAFCDSEPSNLISICTGFPDIINLKYERKLSHKVGFLVDPGIISYFATSRTSIIPLYSGMIGINYYLRSAEKSVDSFHDHIMQFYYSPIFDHFDNPKLLFHSLGGRYLYRLIHKGPSMSPYISIGIMALYYPYELEGEGFKTPLLPCITGSIGFGKAF